MNEDIRKEREEVSCCNASASRKQIAMIPLNSLGRCHAFLFLFTEIFAITIKQFAKTHRKKVALSFSRLFISARPPQSKIAHYVCLAIFRASLHEMATLQTERASSEKMGYTVKQVLLGTINTQWRALLTQAGATYAEVASPLKTIGYQLFKLL